MKHDAGWWNDAWTWIADHADHNRPADFAGYRRHCRSVGIAGPTHRANILAARVRRLATKRSASVLLLSLRAGFAGRVDALPSVWRAD